MSTRSAGPERLRRLQKLFDEVVDLTDSAREPLLAQLAIDEPDLASELRALLAAEQADAGLDAGSVFRHLDDTLKQLLPESLSPGSVAGAYRVEAEIGAGGMGRVFRARRDDPTLDQEVAIKVVRREMMTAKALARFDAERAVLARLRHPGICQFLDAGRLADGSPYFVMELLTDAVPITTFADRERLGIDDRIALFRKVVAAVQYAHRNLVVHRDIKVGNVLVLPDGQPKLLDFGIAKSLAAEDGDNPTATGDRFFSIASAAPEQLTGAAVTVGCDVYSLGVLLYELLCGVSPFDASTSSLPALIERVTHQIPEPMQAKADRLEGAAVAARQATPPALRRALSGDIEDLVQRCLRKSAHERYLSAEALDADLERLQHNLPLSIRGGQAWYRLRKFVARHRVASVLASALLVLLVASAWVVFQQNLRIRAERDQATEALSVLRDAFLSADPARMGGDSVTARQVMDSAYAALERRIGTQPVAFLDLIATMAEVELSLDGSDRALRLTTRALDTLQTAKVNPSLRERLSLLHASALSGNGNGAEAAALLDAMSPVLPEHEVEWLIVKGRNLTMAGKLADAEPVLRAAVLRTRDASPDDRSANRAHMLLADNYSRQGKLDASLAVLAEMHAWHEPALPATHPYVLLADLQRASTLRRLERNGEALEIVRGAASLAGSSYGDTSAMSARAQMTLGNVLISMELYPEAEAALRRSRDALERILGRQHPNTVRAQFNLAVAMDRPDRNTSEVTRELERAYNDVRSMPGDNRNFAATVCLQYARHLIRTNKFPEARTLLNDPDLKSILSTVATPELIAAATEAEELLNAADTTSVSATDQ